MTTMTSRRSSFLTLLLMLALTTIPHVLLVGASSPAGRANDLSPASLLPRLVRPTDERVSTAQKRAWWQRKESSTVTPTSTTEKQKTDTPSEPKQTTRTLPRNPFNRPKNKTPVKDQDSDNTGETKPVDGEALPAHNTTAPASTNQTALPQQQQQQIHPLGSPNLVILGTAPMGPSNHQYAPYARQPGGTQGRGNPSPATQGSMVLVDMVNLGLALATRLWFIPMLAGWMSRQEESIQPTQHFFWEKLNDRYSRDCAALKKTMQAPPAGISLTKWRSKHVWKQSKRKAPTVDLLSLYSKTAIVLEVKSDVKGGIDVTYLSDVVSFLLQQHRSHAFGTHKETGEPADLEVILLVQSPGGSVATYGLAASQVQRLTRETGIKTTACVDKTAASGGYMIASQAETLIAAPFCTVGSVGVIMEGLNFNELARRYGVKPLTIKAGDSKNPLSTFGAVSDEDLARETIRLEKVHEIFKELIVEARPALRPVLDQVADGSVFLGSEALALNLVDSIMTSDEYILERIQAGDRVLKIHRTNPARLARMLHLSSPLDVLPHLRRFVSDKVLGSNADVSSIFSKLVQAGSFVSFAKHILNQQRK